MTKFQAGDDGVPVEGQNRRCLESAESERNVLCECQRFRCALRGNRTERAVEAFGSAIDLKGRRAVTMGIVGAETNLTELRIVACQRRAVLSSLSRIRDVGVASQRGSELPLDVKDAGRVLRSDRLID